MKSRSSHERPGASKQAGFAYAPGGFFVLRTPLLPFDELVAFSAGLAAVHHADAESLAEDRRILRARLRAIADRPAVREAVFVASPSLDESLSAWLRDPESPRGREAELTLVRYFARMTGRATPFGLFSGCATGRIAGETRLQVSSELRRHSRLDMDYLFALCEALGKDPAVRRRQVYRVNSSLYPCAGRLRYAEAQVDEGVRRYHLVAVEPSPPIACAIERAAHGAEPAEIEAAICAMDAEVSPEEARGFVDALIDAQILVSDLAPPVTGPEPTAELVTALDAHEETRVTARRLRQVQEGLDALDAGGLGAAPDRYRQLAAALEGLAAPAKLPRLFQIDLVRQAPEATLGGAPLAEICRGVDLLHWITPYKDPFAEFTKAFADRYGGEDVPLAVALDEEQGVGFARSTSPAASAEPLLANLPFPATPEPDAWRDRDRHLLARVEEARRTGSRSIALDEADLAALTVQDRPPMADSVAIMATVVARSQEALDRGDFQVLLGTVAGPSGAALLGRFCHGDPALRALVEDHLRAEEARAPGAVVAEIVHLPDGRIGNLILRPTFGRHEIPYLGRSGAPAEAQLPISDLFLRLVHDQVRLWSRRLGREVLPRLSCAHNFKGIGNLPLYRFLCTLGRRRRTEGAMFLWGPLAGASFLPRVTAGRLVLSRARWTIRQERLSGFKEARGDERFRALRALAGELGLPRFVSLSERDKELPVDLENVLSVEALASFVKEQREITLIELFPGPDELCCSGPEGRFVHEIVVPLLRAPAAAAPAERAMPIVKRPGPSSFAPGSEWLYAHFYTGASAADQVLAEVITPVAARALAAGAADRWFFLRYADPEWHLRFRLHGAPARLWSEVLQDLFAAASPLLGDGRIGRLVLQTYKRETDRYGGPRGIELAERIFQADSEAVAEIAAAYAGDEGAGARWRLALRGADMMLDDAGVAFEDKRAVIEQSRVFYGGRFHPDRALARAIGDRFRKERASLDAFFEDRLAQDGHPSRREALSGPLGPGLSALLRRSEKTRPLFAELRARDRAGELTQSMVLMAGSYVHMHNNRMLRADALAQELVLYDFLGRLYDAWQARGRQAAS
jgi:thiopeptide-type bacteriocin biosynthesis protein